ncbi:MAG: CYTH domain-containing protein [Lachnospiraceae bacterium]|nr:CYTH domain-containing protein [Lachnospiraceae bacterium]
MEIERKFLVKELPADYETYPHKELEQGYLSTEPVVRIRKAGDTYTLTYKGAGLMVREEYNLPLTKAAYEHLRLKTDGILIHKIRYKIPYQEKYTIELDVFLDTLAPLLLAEVEFSSEEEANQFLPPAWFGEDVTFSTQYHNSTLSRGL